MLLFINSRKRKWTNATRGAGEGFSLLLTRSHEKGSSHEPPQRETIDRLNERDFPQLVGLAVPRGGSQDRDLEVDAFTASMPPDRGIGHQDEGQFYLRFCFPQRRA